MVKDSQTFFERLTGAKKVKTARDDHEDGSPEEKVEMNTAEPYVADPRGISQVTEENVQSDDRQEWEDEDYDEEEEGTLSIDMYETASDLILKTVVAGARPEDLDISINRERVTVRGSRSPDRGLRDSQVHLQELYWGPFSRTVTLPEEVDVENAEAKASQGLLIIKLPKVNPKKETKLRVRTG